MFSRGFGEADDIADGVFCDDIAAATAAAHGEVFEEDFFLQLAEAGGGLEVDFDGVDFAALSGAAGNVEDAGAGLALGEVVFFIAGHAADGKAFGEGGAGLAIAINDTVGQGVGLGAVIDVDVEDVFPKEGFVADFADDEFALLVDGDDIAEV